MKFPLLLKIMPRTPKSHQSKKQTDEVYEKFDKSEQPSLKLALKVIQVKGKDYIKQCMLCAADGRFQKFVSPNVRQIEHHFADHGISRQTMCQGITQYLEAAQQRAYQEKEKPQTTTA
ncbi:Hypothetical_protein [Hexamita inflata]|uniref:Hypothetical_protein n=1 Tax=Hexamita inflata TaxID=28002 RepID=A0AA86TMW4_9EUKA|nr:Hypothetical protein HINF_LOCUS9826 [Hexamita inflata]